MNLVDGTDMATSRPIAWFRLAATFLVVLLVPVFLCRSTAKVKMPTKNPGSFTVRSTARKDFDGRGAEQLKKLKPNFILIGNSEVESAVDSDYLGTRVAPKKLCVLFMRGSLSAVWYLVLKNQVIPSGVNPERVYVFFRENSLTAPWEGSQGMWSVIPTLFHEEDPVFDKVMDGLPVDFKGQASLVLDMIYPVQNKRPVFENLLRKTSTKGWESLAVLKDTTSESTQVNLSGSLQKEDPADPAPKISRRISEEVFSLDKLRSQSFQQTFAENSKTEDPFCFAYWCPRSFLPPMIDLADKNGFSLCFIQMKSRPGDPRALATPDRERYFADLGNYLEQSHCLFFDFSKDPEIDLSWFSNESHIKPDYRKKFTDKLYERVFKQ